MDEALELTSRVEATHFWFRGFRSFVAPAIAEIAGGRRDCAQATGVAHAPRGTCGHRAGPARLHDFANAIDRRGRRPAGAPADVPFCLAVPGDAGRGGDPGGGGGGWGW